MSTFTQATEYTKNCFNRHGLKPYNAITECTKHEQGFVSYDLTVLDFNGHYKAAHGSVIVPVEFTTVQDAETWLHFWYQENKQKAYNQG